MKNLPDGTFDLSEMMEKVRILDDHFPWTALVCIENSHNKCGGKSVPLTWINKVGKACQKMGLKLHCDGARIFNAAAESEISVDQLVKYCDSVSVCLSKGLGAPVGSVIVGTKEFMQR